MNNNRTVICISFRENELWLYDKLKTYSCPTGTIKDILKEYFANKDNTDAQISASKLNLLDF